LASRGGALLLVAVSLIAAVGVACVRPIQGDPIIFVHGQSGSAQQFETDYMRFATNGFPQQRMYVYEYDSTRNDNTVIFANLDALIAQVLTETGAQQIDVLGHSRGTGIMHGYLNSSTERAEQVDDYVNYDGATSASPPGGRRTLAIWGEGSQTRQIVGAQNEYFPNLGHTETVTSADTFEVVFEFLVGRAPNTTNVRRDLHGRATLAGRVVLFQENIAPPTGAELDIWRVDGDTGARLDPDPLYSTTIGGDGSFGPFQGSTSEHYEIAVSRTRTQHFYFSPFPRSDHFLRLNLSREGEGLETIVETGPNHSVVVNVRNREWWADQPGPADNDVLQVDGANVLNATIAPRARRIIAPFLFDDNSDQVTDLSAVVPPFGALPFLTAADVFMASDPQADGTLSLAMTPRGGGGQVETINVPNWPSSTDGITVQWRDYLNLDA
jgi:pimeloyl-ACP methyl ester carboxylesterase